MHECRQLTLARGKALQQQRNHKGVYCFNKSTDVARFIDTAATLRSIRSRVTFAHAALEERHR
jgi:hypothetical protein